MNLQSSKIKLKLFSVAWCLLLAVSPVVSSSELPTGVLVEISSAKTEYSALEPIMIRVRYTNTSDRTVSFLKWDTALEGRVNSDFLLVSSDPGLLPYTTFLPYTGRHYKRAAPTANDFGTISAGGFIEATVNLSEAYALNSKGDYKIQYQAGHGHGAHSTGIAKVGLNIRLSENRPVRLLRQPPTFESCDGGRPSIIDSAVAAAESMARRARDDLQNSPVSARASAQRYRQWFGVYDLGRWNTVQDHFNRIYSAVSGRTLNFICDDTDPAYAYVYPSQPYNIYLGRAFWPAPNTGTDSKGGTIIHELSHFTVLGDTDDIVYGQSGARSLAITNPAGAVRNADSHEYFAENSPALSMPRPGPPTPPPAPPTPPPPPPPPPEPEPPLFIIHILKLLLMDDDS